MMHHHMKNNGVDCAVLLLLNQGGAIQMPVLRWAVESQNKFPRRLLAVALALGEGIIF